MRPISKLSYLIGAWLTLCAGIALAQQTLLQAGGGAGAAGNFVTGLANYWPMTNAQVSGNNVTDTVGGITGTISGNVTSAAGPNGTYAQGRAFDGASNTVITSSGSPRNWNTSSFSVALWLFITANNTASAGGSSQRYYYDDRSGDGLTYFQMLNVAATPGGLRCTTSQGTIQSLSTAVASNTWTHAVCTNSGGGNTGIQAMYINGNVIATNTSSGNDSFTTVRVGLFGNGNVTDGELAGREAGFRIYSRALSAADVLALFNAGG